jgi:probable F420-dependent oxidoreductase
MSRLKAVAQPWEASVTGREITRIARRGEELGFDMLRIPEHFVITRDHVELSGPHYTHATVAQAHLLGATQKIRVGTSVTLLPLQHPIAMAKGLATADWLSGGRLNVAFGVGWLKGEFDAMGVSFEKRGKLADEYLAAIIELFTKEWPCFEGEFVNFKDVAFEPKCAQTPHVPIWIGGDSDAALKRCARFATGWVPFLTKPDDFRSKIDFITSQPTYKGGPFEVMYTLASGFIGEGHVPRDGRGKSIFTAQEMIDTVGWLRDRGVTVASFAIPPVKDASAYLDYAQWFVEEIKPKFT